MSNYFDDFFKALLYGEHLKIRSDRPIYSSVFAIPVNIVAEIVFFTKTFLISPILFFLKIIIRQSPSSLDLFGTIALGVMIYHPKTSNTKEFFLLETLYFIFAFWNTTKLKVTNDNMESAVQTVNNILRSLIISLSTTAILTASDYHISNQSLAVIFSIMFTFSLFTSRYRASMGRRLALLMVASAPLAQLSAYFYLFPLLVAIIFILIPSLHFDSPSSPNVISYTHRDLEVMKLFGQSSASGYGFEERIIGLIDSVGYDTKFAKWYKEKGDYPEEYSVTKGDGGIDLIATSSDSILIIQCKFYSSSAIGADIVAKTYIARKAFARHFSKKGDKRKVTAMIITNNKFDNTAIADAKMEGVILVDGKDIEKMVKSGKLDIRSK